MKIPDRYGTGFIDRSKFHRAYAAKIMRDHIDGKNSKFLSARYDLFSQDYAGEIPDVKELYVYSAYDRIALGGYTPRGALQKHRYTMWQKAEEIE